MSPLSFALPFACLPPCRVAPSPSRRILLHHLVSLPIYLCLLPPPVLADRTGKFSSRLTARRRYLPRISRGVSALVSVARGERDAPNVADTMDDLLPALRLFASSGFGEGAASLPTRVKLKEALDVIVDAAGKAANDETEMRRLLDAIRTYAVAAEIQEAVPTLEIAAERGSR